MDYFFGKSNHTRKNKRVTNASPSYNPTINNQLVTLHSSYQKEKIIGCNNKRAFLLKEPLKILVTRKGKGGKGRSKKRCVPYSNPAAKQLLLHNLSANKHINVKKIVPPRQVLGNCWMNTMFVAFFISDKGRKFFQFFRQLMIDGKLASGQIIEPKSLRDAFALLNYAVESAIMGTPYAYKLNTNGIIKSIYNSLSSVSYYNRNIVKIDEGSNPIGYYQAIINYLSGLGNGLGNGLGSGLGSGLGIGIQMVLANVSKNGEWTDRITRTIMEDSKGIIPHVVVVEIYDDESRYITDRPLSFEVNIGNEVIKYGLDSCIVRDMYTHLHFISLITCEGKEMGYDGMSFGRIKPLHWKKTYLNSPKKWSFEGSTDESGSSGKPLFWSFMREYQMLIYYRM